MRIATWNVNSVRAREAHVLRFLERQRPDLLLLQETKCDEPAFPSLPFEGAGYRATVVGQKGLNGVAILSRVPVETRHRAVPGLHGPVGAAARYLEVAVDDLVVGNLYLPNGNSGGAQGLAGKLDWMRAFRAHVEAVLATDVPALFAGDYNVCPTDVDYGPRTLPQGDALLHPDVRAEFRALIHAGLTDALRATVPSGPAWTFWDYQAGAWPQDRGLRIDHLLLAPALAERMTDCTVDRVPRGEDQPSDHTPVVLDLAS